MTRQLKLIEKHMLAEALRLELDNKIDSDIARSKNDLITMDDLDPELREKLTNSFDRNATPYNDTAIRNDIIALEKDKIDTADAFNKYSDLVSFDMLDDNLKTIIINAEVVGDKATQTYVDETFRRLDTPIKLTDMEDNFQVKFNGMVDKVNILSDIADNAGDLDQRISSLEQRADTLDTQKLSITRAQEEYWSKNEKIPISALESAAQTNINKIPSIETTLAGKAETSYLERSFRRKDVAILESDLDQELQDDINLAVTAANNIEAAVEDVITNYHDTVIMPAFRSEFGGTDVYTGNINLLPETDQIDVYLNYLYPASFGNAIKAYTGGNKITITSACNYLYDYIVNARNSSGSLNSKISELENEVSNLQSKLSSAQSTISALSSRVAALESSGGGSII